VLTAQAEMSGPKKFNLGLCLDLSRWNDPEFTKVSLPCDSGQAGSGLTDDDVSRLCDALEDNVCVKSLVLWGNQRITSLGGAALLKLLKTNKTIERINLDLTDVPDSDKELISRRLLERRLATLDLSNPELDSIVSLDLSRSGVRNVDVGRIAESLKENVKIAHF
jgi:hypothetical protein